MTREGWSWCGPTGLRGRRCLDIKSPRLSDDGAGRSRLKGLTPNLLGLTHTYYHSLRYHHMQMGNRTLT